MSATEPSSMSAEAQGASDPHPDATPSRVFAGGVLMGLANLVPGVSGGTMILALGLYDRFIEAVSNVARLRISRSTLVFLGVLGAGIVIAILGLATPAVWLVREHRPLAYSLFIGMTLGGVPMLWAIVRPLSAGVLLSALAGVALMALVAFGLQSTPLPPTGPVFIAAGALAASSMILPGISGSYILLILGLYDVVVGSVRPGVLRADSMAALAIVVPVGIGAALGIGLLSNLLRVVLKKYERRSHAVLLGLLVGSVLGLWPFQRPVHPDLADEARMAVVEDLVTGVSPSEAAARSNGAATPDEAAELQARYGDLTRGEVELMALDYASFRPTAGGVLLVLVVMSFGFAITLALGAGLPKRSPRP